MPSKPAGSRRSAGGSTATATYPVAAHDGARAEPPTFTTPLPYLTVALGASAGGLQAFTEFLANTPSDTGMAFVLIQHLDPIHKSLLVSLLQRPTPA